MWVMLIKKKDRNVSSDEKRKKKTRIKYKKIKKKDSIVFSINWQHKNVSLFLKGFLIYDASMCQKERNNNVWNVRVSW